MERDKYTCQRCGRRHFYKNPIHIHHIVSFANKDKRFDLDNLIIICRDCHYWIHSNKNINKEYIKNYE